MKIKLIGLCGMTHSGRRTTAGIIRSLYGNEEWKEKRFSSFPLEIVSRATGIALDDLEKEDVKNSYLPADWSYIREERFTDSMGVSRKPVRYYLTVQAILKRLDLEVGRQIHSNFWVNSLFNDWKKENGRWVISDVRYPNEAEAIQDRGGIIVRLNRNVYRSLQRYDYTMEGWKADETIDNQGTVQELSEKVATMMKKYE